MTVNSGSERELFVKYLASRRLLIADPSAASRSGIVRVFADLGAKAAQVTLVNSYRQAEQQIAEVKPHIVVTEYELGRRCGLDLIQNQRESRPESSKESLFVVVTANTSQSAVARAAEEDIDAYILKPFTVGTVRATIMKAAMNKLHPPHYLLTIEKGKQAMVTGDFDGAEQLFVQATSLDAAPALAYYYLGQVKFVRHVMNQARGSYSKGLQYNKIHYKCLVGLYELHMLEKNHGEAYEVVKRISQYFPANPKRLAEVLRLAIVNGKYEDVEKYYSIFCNIEGRDDTLIKYICAALVVCGRYYLGTKTKSRALDLFAKAVATGKGQLKIVKEIVQALLDSGHGKEAAHFMARVALEDQSSATFALLAFRVADATAGPALVLERGGDLLQRGIFDAHTYEILIRRSLEVKRVAAAETYYYQAIERFPAHRSAYQQLVASVLKV